MRTVDPLNQRTAPTEQAIRAYECAVSALRLVDALNMRPDVVAPDDAHQAGRTALRAALATFLLIISPGGDRRYYAAASQEIYMIMFSTGNGVADALKIFLEHGFEHTPGVHPDHHPFTIGTSNWAHAECGCGWRDRRELSVDDAQDVALEHGRWGIVQPIMPIPSTDESNKRSWKDLLRRA